MTDVMDVRVIKYGPGSTSVTGEQMARQIADALRLDEEAALARMRPAKVRCFGDLATANMAVTYYACRLLQDGGALGQGRLW